MTFILEFLSRELESGGRVMEIQPVAQDLGLAFRADAKAEGQHVCVGGWECLGGCRPAEARWFSVVLTRKSAPWAFCRGEPYRTIAPLELFSTLCVMLFGDRWPTGATGSVQLEGVTDNLGNTFSLAKLMSSKFPLVTILCELAVQLRDRSMGLRLTWAPRDQNTEADALTNENFAAFSEERRLSVEVESLKWKVLPAMLEAADAIYAKVREERAAAAAASRRGPPAAKRRVPLRQSDPW